MPDREQSTTVPTPHTEENLAKCLEEASRGLFQHRYENAHTVFYVLLTEASTVPWDSVLAWVRKTRRMAAQAGGKHGGWSDLLRELDCFAREIFIRQTRGLTIWEDPDEDSMYRFHVVLPGGFEGGGASLGSFGVRQLAETCLRLVSTKPEVISGEYGLCVLESDEGVYVDWPHNQGGGVMFEGLADVMDAELRKPAMVKALVKWYQRCQDELAEVEREQVAENPVAEHVLTALTAAKVDMSEDDLLTSCELAASAYSHGVRVEVSL